MRGMGDRSFSIPMLSFIWRLYGFVLLNLLLGIERYRSGKASGMPGEFSSGLALRKERTIRLGFVYFGTPQ